MRALSPNPEQSKSLSLAAEILLKELAYLGENGGKANDSIYDTAMVVRLAPPEEGSEQAIQWLLRQQHEDGGWDNPKVLRARDMPTLAAVLALHDYAKAKPRSTLKKQVRRAVERGLAFLREQRPYWNVLPEDLLVGVEMNLTRLLEEAQARGLRVPMDQYAAVIEDGKRRRKKLCQLPVEHVRFGTPPALMWEGWGRQWCQQWGKAPPAGLVDPDGGVGPCPAATAAWVHEAKHHPELQEKVKKAREYLRSAEKGTNLGTPLPGSSKLRRIPGVVPATWRIDLMEMQWGLLALLCTGLLEHPLLKEAVGTLLGKIEEAFTPRGTGFTKYFMPDGDCTAVTAALLKSMGRPVDMAVVKQFARGDYFYTYPQETHPSLTTTAHAVMALNIAGEDTSHWVTAMLKQQSADGRWLTDKWQTSWLYTTTHVMLAIRDPNKMRTSIDTLLRHQKADGGWGTTRVETAFAVSALLPLRNHKDVEQERIRSALTLAKDYLRKTFAPGQLEGPENQWTGAPMWIGKALYCPYRMDRAFELSAMLALELAEG